jgi:excisionase family DNA binding protein
LQTTQFKTPDPNAVGLSVADVVARSGLGRSSIYEALASGQLPARKFGKRTLILKSDFDDWINSLPAMKPTVVIER